MAERQDIEIMKVVDGIQELNSKESWKWLQKGGVTRHTGGAVITMTEVWTSAFHRACFFILAILMKPCVNMNSNSSQKGIEEETLL